MVDDAAAAAYRRYQQEEYERRILQQIKERPNPTARIQSYEEAKDRWKAADGEVGSGLTERRQADDQRVLTRHVLSLNRIRREEVEAMRGQSTAPPIKRWMRNGVNRVALSRVRPRRRSSDPECPVCLELLRADVVVAPCGHAFCETCLEAAFCKSVTCPMCRADCRAFAAERGWAVEARPTRLRAPVAFAPRRQRLPPVLPPASSRKDPLRAIKGLERAHRETTRSISTLAADVSDASRRGDVLRKKLSALRRSHAAARILFSKPLAPPIGGG